jgi:hypothetical protein
MGECPVPPRLMGHTPPGLAALPEAELHIPKLTDHLPAYISRAQYEHNLRQLAANLAHASDSKLR